MQSSDDNTYLDKLRDVCDADVSSLIQAQANYGNSWKKRGGVGAFMMLARKWDRLENFLRGDSFKFDIFEAVKIDKRPEGIIDDIRDLRRYLLLVEAEMRARGTVAGEVNKYAAGVGAQGGPAAPAATQAPATPATPATAAGNAPLLAHTTVPTRRCCGTRENESHDPKCWLFSKTVIVSGSEETTRGFTAELDTPSYGENRRCETCRHIEAPATTPPCVTCVTKEDESRSNWEPV